MHTDIAFRLPDDNFVAMICAVWAHRRKGELKISEGNCSVLAVAARRCAIASACLIPRSGSISPTGKTK